MRDDSRDYDLYEAEAATRPSRLGAALAATTAIAVLVLAVTWTYRLGVRDAGDVPVIRAAEGPARIRPEDPGGETFDHQGRAVYSALGGGESASTAAAPAFAPAPEPLTGEDLSQAQREGVTVMPPAIIDEVDQLVAAVLGEAASAAAKEATPPTLSAAPLAPLPPPRPVAAASTPSMPAVAPGSVEVAALGGALVQLGAYLSEADALAMWPVLRDRHPDLLGGREHSVSMLEGATRTLHRLRAGPFPSVEAAQAFCGALRERGADCLVTGPN